MRPRDDFFRQQVCTAARIVGKTEIAIFYVPIFKKIEHSRKPIIDTWSFWSFQVRTILLLCSPASIILYENGAVTSFDQNVLLSTLSAVIQRMRVFRSTSSRTFFPQNSFLSMIIQQLNVRETYFLAATIETLLKIVCTRTTALLRCSQLLIPACK